MTYPFEGVLPALPLATPRQFVPPLAFGAMTVQLSTIG